MIRLNLFSPTEKCVKCSSVWWATPCQKKNTLHSDYTMLTDDVVSSVSREKGTKTPVFVSVYIKMCHTVGETVVIL